MALFFGGSLDTKFKDEVVENRNKTIMTHISKPIAQANKSKFRRKLDGCLSLTHRPHIHEFTDAEYPFIDSYGRVTYFYIVLGDTILPIYQPGSVMFETAIRADS